MTDQFINLVGYVFKTYGLHAGFLICILYLFFFKYIPEQAAALKHMVDVYDSRLKDIIEQFSKTLETERNGTNSRLKDIVEQFSKTLEAERNGTKDLFNMFASYQKQLMETQERFMNMALEKIDKELERKS
jgi:hypothetical protein